jgi:hypothetical protein
MKKIYATLLAGLAAALLFSSCNQEDAPAVLTGEWRGIIRDVRQFSANAPVFESSKPAQLIFREDGTGRLSPLPGAGGSLLLERDFTYEHDHAAEELLIHYAPAAIDTIVLAGGTERYAVTRFTARALEVNFMRVLLDSNLQPAGKWEEYWEFSR